MLRVSRWRWVRGMVVFCGATAMFSSAQVTYTTLVNFNRTDGESPFAMALVQGVDGSLYGTTSAGGIVCGGSYGCGTIFTTTPSGGLTTLYQFCSQTGCTDGTQPMGTLVQANDGNFYGITNGGGRSSCTSACGTIFKVSPTGSFTTLHTFCTLAKCADGKSPYGGLLQATNGNFYGTTQYGNKFNNTGTVFEITPAGKLTTLYSFCSIQPRCADGSQPDGSLIQASNGNFYGETLEGGTYGYGTIFEITPKGSLTTLYSFNSADGDEPYGGLIQAADGNLYGVTLAGGAGYGCIFSSSGDGCGTVFKITPTGTLTTLYNFCAVDCTASAYPYGQLLQGTDGNFYGTTFGYSRNGGAVFEITPTGTLTTLITFEGVGSPYGPAAGLAQDTNGNFYGTTSGGGTAGDGTVFSFSTGLAPFVKIQPAFGQEGTTIGLFGQGFSSSSIVRFGGVRATAINISANSPYFAGATFLTAKVPAGALTGSVTVTTGATTLTSNQIFRVKPQVVSFDPPSGSVGTQVTITGTGFTQTNGVGFGDNVPAEFTVNSDTQVTATVPTGAKTGPVGVVTKGGTAISTATFTVN